jgi:hypothetical protein
MDEVTRRNAKVEIINKEMKEDMRIEYTRLQEDAKRKFIYDEYIRKQKDENLKRKSEELRKRKEE